MSTIIIVMRDGLHVNFPTKKKTPVPCATPLSLNQYNTQLALSPPAYL